MAWIGDDYEVNRRSGFENPLRLFRFLPLFAEFEDTAGHVARDVARFAQPGAALVEATDDLVDRILPDLHRIMLTPDSRTAQKYFRKNPDCKHPKTASNDNSEPNVEEQGL